MPRNPSDRAPSTRRNTASSANTIDAGTAVPLPVSDSDATAGFHPLIRAWFAEEIGTPTDIQNQSWPIISAGEHVLISAPTGSGKTLTAFLYALNQLITGAWEMGHTSVLYISPLKALNTDIQRNLLSPLGALRDRFEAAHTAMPAIRVQTRSGDTPGSERARMLRSPPEILITTPESLNLLLTTVKGRLALTRVRTVILDEIHALVGNRRGVQLSTGIERLADLAGEFQRVALSATVEPMATVASWLGGFQPPTHAAGDFIARSVTTLRSDQEKAIALNVSFPEAAVAGRETGVPVWDPISDVLRDTMQGNTSTLVFTNNRRLTEKLVAKVNEPEREPVAYAHHGSLAKDIRSAVESRLKSGELKGIIATSSLEMGIDIGELDRVVLVNTPPTVSGTLQRIGRAGHGVGQTSHGTLLPTYGHDFLQAIAMAGAVSERAIESISPMTNALDVLAQTLISMTASESWNADDLYALLRCSSAYHTLPRRHFDLVVDMLIGRFADARIRDLKPKLALDRATNTLTARKGAVLALYTGGGTIPDRGYYQLRHHDTAAKIGELDEEFVWEAVIGQVFNLGSQHWQVSRITHNDVFVRPARPTGTAPPFWRADDFDRRHHLSTRIADWLEHAETVLSTPARRAQTAVNSANASEEPARRAHAGKTPVDESPRSRLLREAIDEYVFDECAASELLDYLEHQREHTGTALPHRHHMVIECIQSGPGGYRGPDRDYQIALHTCWGGTLNRPFALALAAAWRANTGETLETHVGNDALIIQTKRELDPDQLLGFVHADNVEALLRESLETSAYFGARFRECAGRALLLAPKRFNQRQPLWMTRLDAKKLMTSVARFPDFPMLLEAWRTCLTDEFELSALRERLAELADGAIAVSIVHVNTPSPFAGQLAFDQISTYMYADDKPEQTDPTALQTSLIEEATHNPALRPQVSRAIAAEFEYKRQRLAEDYSPADGPDVVEFLKERVLVTWFEWEQLLAAITRDHGEAVTSQVCAERRILKMTLPDQRSWVLAADNAEVVSTQFELIEPAFSTIAHTAEPDAGPTAPARGRGQDQRSRSDLLAEILMYYGPTSATELTTRLPLPGPVLAAELTVLRDAETLISGDLIKAEPGAGAESPTDGATGSAAGGQQWCDSETFGALLRMERAAARPSQDPQPVTALPRFLAHWQGLTGTRAHVADTLGQLAGWQGPAELWEHEWLPARHPDYAGHQLDELLREDLWYWLGTKPGMIVFTNDDERALVDTRTKQTSAIDFPDTVGRYRFHQLLDASAAEAETFSSTWWEAVWSGAMTSDDFSPLRRGISSNFQLSGGSGSAESTPPDEGLPGATSAVRRSAQRPRLQGASTARRAARGRARGWPGLWRQLPVARSTDDTLDALDTLELAKDRARLVLDRYGIVNRELLQREQPALRFRHLFRALRLMELSGEVVSGLFFHGMAGPQFALPRAVRQWAARATVPGADASDGPPVATTADRDVFWCNATDPAAPCGLGLDWPGELALPRRLPANHLVFRGSTLVATSEQRGRRLSFSVAPDDPDLAAIVAPLDHLLHRDQSPHPRLAIETINGERATASPFLTPLADLFRIERDHRRIYLAAERY